jgi:hypothetical protein
LLKAMDVSHLAPEQRQDLQKQATLLAEHYGFLPDAYIGLRIARSRGYTLYQRGIKLQTTQGLREISEVSSLVQTLIQPHERALLLYPREIESKLRRYLDQHLA